MYHPFCRRIRKVKTLQFTVMLLIMIAELSCCQGSTSAELVINFKVPKGWKRINDSVFVRTNYEEEFRFWYNDLREGHMPWRGDPKNIAVTCLWSFGIHDGSPVWVFANRLTQVKKIRFIHSGLILLSMLFTFELKKKFQSHINLLLNKIII